MVERKQCLRVVITCCVIATIGIYLMGCAAMIKSRVEVTVPSFTVIFCPPGDPELPIPYATATAKFDDGSCSDTMEDILSIGAYGVYRGAAGQ